MASPDGDLRQGSKATLRNYLISESNALSSVLVQKAKWIVDGIPVIRSMQSRLTWGEFFQAFVEACTSDKGLLPVALDKRMDTYEVGRTKEMTQNCRGTTTRKIVIGGADQAKPKSCDCATFLSDRDYKTELSQFIAGYCKARNFRRKLKMPVTIRCSEGTWLLNNVGVHQLPSCNHHEADARIIRHVVQFNDSNPVVVVASDTTFLFSLSMPLIDYY